MERLCRTFCLILIILIRDIGKDKKDLWPKKGHNSEKSEFLLFYLYLNILPFAL